MSDLVTRLRERRLRLDPSAEHFGGSLSDPLCQDAADRIEELERERELFVDLYETAVSSIGLTPEIDELRKEALAKVAPLIP